MPDLSLVDFTLHYLDETIPGPGRSAVTLVLIHGDLASSAWWRPFISRLPAGWRVIAPDLRGCGRSSRPLAGYAIEQYAADLTRLLAVTHPGPFILVGHSMGGAVAMTYGLAHPDDVTAMVLVDPVPAEGLRFGRVGREAFFRLKDNPDMLIEAVHRAMHTAPRDDFFRLVVADAAVADRRVFTDNVVSMEEFNVFGRLHRLSLPTLVIVGDQDRLIPKPQMIRTAQAIPRSTVAMIEGSGHSPQVEKPDEFARLVIAFIEEVGRAAAPPSEPRPMSDFGVGQKTIYHRPITAEDIEAFGGLIGDYNPLHFDQAYAARTRFGGRIGHGMLTAALISAAVGMRIPGPGGVYLRQEARFLKPVSIGDTVTVEAEVIAVNVEKRRLVFRTDCFNQRGEKILAGEAELLVT